MEALIETFHIDWRLLLAQVVNFGVAFGVLYFFALKPLAKVMEERTEKINKGLKYSEETEKKLAQISEDYKKEISRAKNEAAQIVEKAREAGDEKKNQMIAQAKDEINQMITQEKAALEREKEKIAGEIKSEITELVIASVKKIIGKEISEKRNEEIIKEILTK